MQNTTQAPSGSVKDESQLVTFLLKDEEFGFDIMSVQEIIRLPKMAKVPRTPAYVDGIANLRGVVLPVIDMRTRFGMERAAETDRTRVLVVDIDGVKTGLRVDRVKQVTRVMRSEIEPPPAAICSTTSDYLEGVVKLDQGQRIVMALNAAQVCQIDLNQKKESITTETGTAGAQGEKESITRRADVEVQKMVTFRIAKEEYAFNMEHVREILRVETPKQVPEVPHYVLGVLTVRGQILPVLDLRRLLQQPPLADEFVGRCEPLRVAYSKWVETLESALARGTQGRINLSVSDQLRQWLSETNSSSQSLMEALAKVRSWNEMVSKQYQAASRADERGDAEAASSAREEALASARETIAALERFEALVPANIQEDQRIIVVDAEGVVLGLVVDHVHEVLNIAKDLVEPPPKLGASGGMELSGVAKLEDGSRLILLLDAASLIRDQSWRDVQRAEQTQSAQGTAVARSSGRLSTEVQLVTFLLGDEEYGIPISQIQEIDRLARITKVPKAPSFIEGVTNLRGEVIPVLDTRKRFELEVKAPDDRTRIIIVDFGGVKTGLVVDSVREVLNLSSESISPPPEAIGSSIDQQFISGIGEVNSGARMIVLLDIEKILSRQEQAHLSEIAS